MNRQHTGARASLAAFTSLMMASSAQVELYSVTGAADEAFAYSAAGLGDIDGDGVIDLAIGNPVKAVAFPNGTVAAGQVDLFSGATGSLLWSATQDPASAFGSLGLSVTAVDDLNGDGAVDLAVVHSGSIILGESSRLDFLSGLDGSSLGATEPVVGVSSITGVINVSDADGDGLRDVLSIDLPGGVTTVLALYSSSTGMRLREWSSPSSAEQFNGALVEVGDIDGGGRADYAVGMEGSGSTPDALRVVSAETGQFIQHILGTGAGWSFGFNITPFTDLDSDGLAELAVLERIHPITTGKAFLRHYSMADGSLVRSTSQIDATLHGDLVNVGDYDRDGVDDLAVGLTNFDRMTMASSPKAGAISIFSGASGHEVGRYEGTAPGLALGDRILPTGDLNGDGWIDFVATGAGSFGGTALIPGSLVALASEEFATFAFCDLAAPNSLQLSSRLESSGTTSIALNDLHVIVRDLPTGVFGYLLVSATPNSTPGPAGGLPLCLGGSVGRLNQPGLVMRSDATGSLDVPIDLLRIPSPTGLAPALPLTTLYFQCWHRDTTLVGGSSLSNGLGALILP